MLSGSYAEVIHITHVQAVDGDGPTPRERLVSSVDGERVILRQAMPDYGETNQYEVSDDTVIARARMQGTFEDGTVMDQMVTITYTVRGGQSTAYVVELDPDLTTLVTKAFSRGGPAVRVVGPTI